MKEKDTYGNFKKSTLKVSIDSYEAMILDSRNCCRNPISKEILDLMIAGIGPHKIIAILKLQPHSITHADRTIRTYLRQEFSSTFVEKIMKIYYRLVYWQIFFEGQKKLDETDITDTLIVEEVMGYKVSTKKDFNRLIFIKGAAEYLDRLPYKVIENLIPMGILTENFSEVGSSQHMFTLFSKIYHDKICFKEIRQMVGYTDDVIAKRIEYFIEKAGLKFQGGYWFESEVRLSSNKPSQNGFIFTNID